MRVIIACERSGVVREAFAQRGHDAWSCDVEETDIPGHHFRCDVLTVLDRGWDLMIAHPECRYLCSSGLHRNGRTRDASLTDKALEFVRALMSAPIPKIAIENPTGRIGTAIRPADQYVHPYWFGDDASKKTGLWLKGLHLLVPTNRFPPRIVTVNGVRRERWGNQTDSGQNRLGPSPERSYLRAKTYPGFAAAMAEQWGSCS